MLREVHTGLYQALTTETRSTTLVLIIKTAGVLAQETPYDSLPTGTVSKFMLHLQKLSLDKTLDHRLMKVSISSLTSFIGARVTTQEVFDALDPTSSTVLEQMDKILETETTWSIKTEVFRFFSSLALHFPRLMIAHWKSVFSIILNTITGESAQENDPNTRHAAAKVVDDFSKALLHLSSSPSQSPLDQFTSELWQGILNSRLSELMVKDRFANVRSAICNLFSQVPAPVFATLSRKHQVMCITLQLGAIKDEVPAVRSQAARALGIYILNHALKVDPLFVSDVALALVEAMKDKNLNVRTKAAWSAANLCDALVSVRESSVSGSYSVDDDGELENRNGLEDTQGVSPSDDVPRETLIQLAKTVLSACRDNDKVRCNAIRAVGNFMRFSNKNTFSESKYEEGQLAPPLVKQLIETLLHYTHEGSAKVRWNACYALANLFHNPYIVNTFQWATERAIDALLAVLKTSSNFKVRINAATALLIAIASSSALPMSPTLIESILKVVTPLAAEGTLTELESPEGLDSRYNESLRDNLRRLIVTCLAHMSSSAPNTLTSGQILLVASHLSTFREAINLTSSLSDASSSSKSDPNSHEMGEDGSGNMEDHTQLKPPSAKEMKSLADRALDLVNRVASLP
jgi:HEAT repeat protein